MREVSSIRVVDVASVACNGLETWVGEERFQGHHKVVVGVGAKLFPGGISLHAVDGGDEAHVQTRFRSGLVLPVCFEGKVSRVKQNHDEGSSGSGPAERDGDLTVTELKDVVLLG